MNEGERVAISQVAVDGNKQYNDGRWWGTWPPSRRDSGGSRRASTTRTSWTRTCASGCRSSTPTMATSISRSLTIPWFWTPATGKASLDLHGGRGDPVRGRHLRYAGNRRFSSEELMIFYPFGPSCPADSRWAAARVQQVGMGQGDRGGQEALQQQRLHLRPGEPQETRRTGADGKPVIDLRWIVQEGPPATINKMEIVGNDVTHERVIREAIVMLPGELFSRDRLIRSYQNVSNLGFFQQPMPLARRQAGRQRRATSTSFSRSRKRGPATSISAPRWARAPGSGGFLGLEEPNLFGRGKRGQPPVAVRQEHQRFHSELYRSGDQREPDIGHDFALRLGPRYTIGDLGPPGPERRLPPVRLSVRSAIATPGSTPRTASSGSVQRGVRRSCAAVQLQRCTRSTLALSLVRDTRIDMPFPTGGEHGHDQRAK